MTCKEEHELADLIPSLSVIYLQCPSGVKLTKEQQLPSTLPCVAVLYRNVHGLQYSVVIVILVLGVCFVLSHPFARSQVRRIGRDLCCR